MFETKEVLKALNSKLKTLFNVPIYGKETKEGYKMPCFNTELVINSFSKVNKNITKLSLTLNVAYLQETVDQVKQYEVIKKMQENFYEYLVVNNRTFHIKEFTQDYTGTDNDILEFTIDIDIYENLYQKIIDKPITDVDLKIQRKECGGIMKN